VIILIKKAAQNELLGLVSIELPPSVLELSKIFLEIFPEFTITHNSIILPHKKKQNEMATWYYTEFKRKLEENFCLQHENDPDFHEKWITLQSNSQSLAHQWLDAFPNEGLAQTMTNTMFDTMVKGDY
jgi:hypothetical protein